MMISCYSFILVLTYGYFQMAIHGQAVPYMGSESNYCQKWQYIDKSSSNMDAKSCQKWQNKSCQFWQLIYQLHTQVIRHLVVLKHALHTVCRTIISPCWLLNSRNHFQGRKQTGGLTRWFVVFALLCPCIEKFHCIFHPCLPHLTMMLMWSLGSVPVNCIVTNSMDCTYYINTPT